MNSQWIEFFIFAGLLVLNTLLLMFVATRYTYVSYGDGRFPLNRVFILPCFS